MNPFFIEALNMREHPIKKAKRKLKKNTLLLLHTLLK